MLSILVISCDVSSLLPAPMEIPTSIPGVVDTIVAMTAGAAYSQTASLIPPTATASFTPPPTWTPTLTPTLTPTFIFRLSTRTAIPSVTPTGSTGELACREQSQTPGDGTHYAAKASFSVSWKVKNTGDATWDAGSVDFIYWNGTKMYKAAAYDLPHSVAVGDSITLSVSMVAPKNDGSYNTTWALRKGKDDFCHVSLKIIVP